MVFSPRSTAGPKKRDFDEYQENGQTTESGESVKKPRLDVRSEKVHSFNDLFEDPPENWKEDEMVELWGDLLNDPEPEGGVQLDEKQQQKSENRPGEVSAWITADSNVKHKPMLAKQDMPTLSTATATEERKEPNTLNEEKNHPVLEAEYSMREIPTLSEHQSVQHTSSSTENTLKPRFPPADTPLPEGISLDKLCRHWPHHLIGRTLRRFIEEGCTAGWIFVRLDYFVRKALDKEAALEKKKGWEVIRQRLDEEKARMAEEEKQAGLQAQNDTSAEASNRPATTSKSAPEAVVPQKKRLQSQEQSPSEGTRDTRQLLPTSHIERVNKHQHEIQHELAKQQRILQAISFADPSWVHKTPEERVQHEGQHWIDQARSYEKQIIELLGRDVVGIDFQSTKPRDMLTRQLELIKRVLIKRAPFPENASVQDTRLHEERLEATSIRQQRDVLRKWTVALEELLAGVRDTLSRGNGTIATSSGTPRSNAAQPQAHGSHSPSPMRQSGSSDSRRLSNLPAKTQKSQVFGHQRPENRLSSSRDRDSIPIHSPIGLPSASQPAAPVTGPEGSSAASKTDQSGQLPYGFSSIDRQYDAFPVPSVPQPQIGYQGKSLPVTGSSVLPLTAKPSIPTVAPGRKRRGAPRTLMFPKAPPRNTPLSALAKVDNEEVLRSFPEHLSIPEVMRRFVRPNGAKFGGWQTKKMVDYLLKHENERDHKGILEEERRANLSRWVTKERDACNNKIRKELRIPKKTAKETRTVQNHASSTNGGSVLNTQQATLQSLPAHLAPAYSQNGYCATLISQDGHPSSSYVQNAFPTAPYPQNQYSIHSVATGGTATGYGRNISDVPSGLDTQETSQDTTHHVARAQGGLSDALSPSGSGLQGSLLNTPFMSSEWCDLEDADGDLEPQD